MTARTKKNDTLVDESQIDKGVQLTKERELVRWRNSKPIERTRDFIKWCREQKVDFIDSDFQKYAKDWIDILLKYDDSFRGDHAPIDWDTHCKNFLREIIEAEDSQELEGIVNHGISHGKYTVIDSSEHQLVINFSWLLWLFGLSDRPSVVITGEKKLEITLIGQGKLVFTQLKYQKEITKIILVENAEIDYHPTLNNITNNTGSNISTGASEQATVTQTIARAEES